MDTSTYVLWDGQQIGYAEVYRMVTQKLSKLGAHIHASINNSQLTSKIRSPCGKQHASSA